MGRPVPPADESVPLYADITYQIRRPDSLANRVAAFKCLVLGGSVVPIFTLGFVYVMRVRPGPDEAVLMQPDWQYQLSRAGKVAKYNVGEWLKRLGLTTESENMRSWVAMAKKMTMHEYYRTMGLDKELLAEAREREKKRLEGMGQPMIESGEDLVR
uniref:Uncharacterized protein n=1 Tax=Vitrella brassicaformis TaxID=1169539 RepID=A0A7S1P943_9ALVE|mmetsp:Transcript_42477/g.106038  ORF Transcript_42477/g.106038 Transcript_42477/m.106038 type:complete len:157 (+) Transcript_42477:1571-2041(+)